MAGRTNTEFYEQFEPLYRECHALARRLLGSDELAEAVATEALARAYARWGKVRTLPNPEGWALRLTSELAAEALAADSYGAPSIGVSVARLAPQTRDAVVLRYLTALDESEISVVLGVAPETARELILEGLTELRARGTWSAGVSAA